MVVSKNNIRIESLLTAKNNLDTNHARIGKDKKDRVVAIAAPRIPNLGIKIIFRKMFKIAAIHSIPDCK